MNDQPRRTPLWRGLLAWRYYEMPHAARTWAILYVVLVLGLSGVCGVIGISSTWAFLAGGVLAIALTVALEAAYRQRNPVR